MGLIEGIENEPWTEKEREYPDIFYKFQSHIEELAKESNKNGVKVEVKGFGINSKLFAITKTTLGEIELHKAYTQDYQGHPMQTYDAIPSEDEKSWSIPMDNKTFAIAELQDDNELKITWEH